jgi:hypothetical protein
VNWGRFASFSVRVRSAWSATHGAHGATDQCEGDAYEFACRSRETPGRAQPTRGGSDTGDRANG